jgi:hypothetical protein
MNIMRIIVEDTKAEADAIAAPLASSMAMGEASLSMDLTREPLFQREKSSFFHSTKKTPSSFSPFS